MNIYQTILKKGDAGVIQTVELMISYVNQYYQNKGITAIVNKIRNYTNSQKYTDSCYSKIALIHNIFKYVKANFKYTPDPQGMELVVSPKHTLLSGAIKHGDCDDLSVILATLLKSAGYPVWFRTVAWKKETGNNFTHVFVMVELPCKSLVLPLDASMPDDNGFGNMVNYFRKKDFPI